LACDEWEIIPGSKINGLISDMSSVEQKEMCDNLWDSTIIYVKEGVIRTCLARSLARKLHKAGQPISPELMAVAKGKLPLEKAKT
jgi:hypothetical protein